MTTPALGAAAAEYGAGKARQVGREVGQARLPTGNRQYQGVILAEFLVAVLIVALAPLARGKQSGGDSAAPWGGSDAGSGAYGPSPYGVDDFKQLLGIGAVYFILALLSSGKHGRFAAWFGGLILVAIGLSQTTSGGLPAIFGIFQPGGTSAGASDTPSDQFPGLAEGAAQAAIGVGQRAAQYQPVQNATGIFPTIGPPTLAPTGQPIFAQQANGTTVYQGGPGVITTNTGTQLA